MSAPIVVYAVVGQSGAYEEFESHVVAVMTDREVAERYARDAVEAYRVAAIAENAKTEMPNQYATDLDPEAEIGGFDEDGSKYSYHVEELLLFGDLPSATIGAFLHRHYDRPTLPNRAES